jgi:prophage regulatory protein
MMNNVRAINRPKEVAKRVGLSVRHVARLEKADRFPKKVRISDNSVGYIEDEVTAWINERIATSRRADESAA